MVFKINFVAYLYFLLWSFKINTPAYLSIKFFKISIFFAWGTPFLGLKIQS